MRSFSVMGLTAGGSTYVPAFICSTFLRSSLPRCTAWIFTAAASSSAVPVISASIESNLSKWRSTSAGDGSTALSRSAGSPASPLGTLKAGTLLESASASRISCFTDAAFLRPCAPRCTAWIFTAAAVCSLSSPTSLRACRPRIAAWIFTAASSSSAVSAITALMSWYDSRYVTCCRVSRSLCSLCAASAWKPFTELTACV